MTNDTPLNYKFGEYKPVDKQFTGSLAVSFMRSITFRPYFTVSLALNIRTNTIVHKFNLYNTFL